MSGPLLASYVALWVLAMVLTVAVVALLRQIGLLHARLQPMGTTSAGEGPRIGRDAPLVRDVRYADAGLTLVAFTATTCEVCARLRPSLRAIERQYPDVCLVELEHGEDTAPTFRAFNVFSTPYFVTVDSAGVAVGAGVANTLEQLEELLADTGRPLADDSPRDDPHDEVA